MRERAREREGRGGERKERERRERERVGEGRGVGGGDQERETKRETCGGVEKLPQRSHPAASSLFVSPPLCQPADASSSRLVLRMRVAGSGTP